MAAVATRGGCSRRSAFGSSWADAQSASRRKSGTRRAIPYVSHERHAPINQGAITSGSPTIRALAIWPLNTTPLGRAYLAALQSQVAVSQDLLQDSPCTRSTGCKQVSRLRAGEQTAQACDIALLTTVVIACRGTHEDWFHRHSLAHEFGRMGYFWQNALHYSITFRGDSQKWAKRRLKVIYKLFILRW